MELYRLEQDIEIEKISREEYIKETAKEEKYKGMSDDELKDIIWNKIKTEVNETVPRYKHITNMIFSKEELVKTTTKKVKRNEEMKKILNNGL